VIPSREPVCPICQSGKLEVIETPKRYYACRDCAFIFLDRDEVLAPEEEQYRYSLHENTIENAGYVRMFERFIEEGVTPFLRGDERVLDFGCGPGPVLAELLKRRGLRVDCYDLYFFPGLDFQKREYDIITSTEVFEHLINPVEVLNRLKESVAENGIIAVMTKFHPGADEFHGWYYRKDETHISFFNDESVRVLSRICGMEIVMSNSRNVFVLKNHGCV